MKVFECVGGCAAFLAFFARADRVLIALRASRLNSYLGRRCGWEGILIMQAPHYAPRDL